MKTKLILGTLLAASLFGNFRQWQICTIYRSMAICERSAAVDLQKFGTDACDLAMQEHPALYPDCQSIRHMEVPQVP
ncbi:MAG: hypothetical protein ABSF98_17115 [Bryobacteraceae bacterium]|jgi:hypothetical protein